MMIMLLMIITTTTYIPYFEDTGLWVSGCIDLSFPNLSTKWGLAVSFMPRQLYRREPPPPHTYLTGGWVVSRPNCYSTLLFVRIFIPLEMAQKLQSV